MTIPAGATHFSEVYGVIHYRKWGYAFTDPLTDERHYQWYWWDHRGRGNWVEGVSGFTGIFQTISEHP